MSPRFIRDLGDGLVLRRASREDSERLATYNADVLRDPGRQHLDEGIAVLTADLMSGNHPTTDATDFTIVEDRHTGAIVSSLCLISQTWSYGGIEFGVGLPELVSTHPDYRQRGLVRAQFDVIHQWSAQRGEQMQAIAGIPYFYRQFGYEMGLPLGGGRAGYEAQVPRLEDGVAEPYRLRPATVTDLPVLARIYERGVERSLVACVRDQEVWRYELSGRSEKNTNRRELRIIETAEGEPVGFVAHPPALVHGRASVLAFELEAGVSWGAVAPSLVRYLWATGQGYAARDKAQVLEAFAFSLGAEHPVYQVMPSRLPHTGRPYAWYVRVPDLLGFLGHLAPVLEARLANSALAGHSGELKISFYRHGVRLVFQGGWLGGAAAWRPARSESGDAGFPNLTFLQLLFGYRSLQELQYAFADCWTANDEAQALLDALFPKQSSAVWALC